MIPDRPRRLFREFRTLDVVNSPLAVPEENRAAISIARGLRVPVPLFWRLIRYYQ